MNNKEIESIYPLSPMQQGMLFHSLYSPESGEYIEQTACRLMGEINEIAFQNAWQSVVDRHPILRTSFVWRKVTQPVQVVQRQVHIPFEWIDWSKCSAPEQDKRLDEFLKNDRQQSFDLAKAPLMRVTLIRLSQAEHFLVWTHHHILLDGWSIPLLVEDMMTCYESLVAGKVIQHPTPRPFRDYIVWLQKQDLSKAKTFWQDYLSGLDAPTPLGFEPDFPETTGKDIFEEIELVFPMDTTQTLQRFATTHGLTLSVMVQAAWAILLNRYTREEDILFGLTVAGRPPEIRDSETMIGLMINTLPVRIQVPTDQPITAWLKALQANESLLSQYEYSPLVQIHEWSQIPGNLPLFESILVFENYPAQLDMQNLGGLKIGNVRSLEQTNFPITLVASAREEFILKMSFNRSRVGSGAAHRALGHLKMILSEMTTHPEAAPVDIELLSPDERHQLLTDWNQTQSPIPMDICTHQFFEAQVDRTPDATALEFGAEHLTYTELDQKANQLAHVLLQHRVGPDTLVAILMDRSFAMIAAFLAVQKAGGAFLPLDPYYPADRINFMLQDSGAVIVLTEHRWTHLLEESKAQTIFLDDDWSEFASQPVSRPVCEVGPHNLAYVIYTSGSTGKPKGVLLEHQGVINLILAQINDYEITPHKRILQFASVSFDAAIAEIYPALCSGAALIQAPKETLTSVKDLTELLHEKNVNIVFLPPSLLAILPSENLPELKTVISAGEALPVDVAQRWSQNHTLFNGYGPTEATVGVAWYRLNPSSIHLNRIPIGRPIPNTYFYVFDPHLHPLPIGIPGELHIGGIGLARGYLNRPDLTHDKFIPDPFRPGTGNRLYKSGDLVRYLPDGNLEFLGRIDHQVKIRGFRIELEEIEAVLLQHPTVRQAAVLALEEKTGEKRLVAYLVPDETGVTLTSTELRTFLKGKLPDYMVPGTYVSLDALPLSPNGKINRKALKIISLSQSTESTKSYLPPHTPTEEILAGIWSVLLHVTPVSADSNFYELGGHSLLATQMVSRIRDVFQIDLPLRSLFNHDTLSGLAEEIDQTMQSAINPEIPALQPTLQTDEIPLSFAQQRLWFLDQLEPGNPFYNLSSAVRLIGTLDKSILKNSLVEIAQRHRSLRTTFREIDGKPFQLVQENLDLPFTAIDLSQITSDEAEKTALALAHQEAKKPFDLSKDSLIRCVLYQIAPQDHLLVLTLHHIITDGWSMGILVSELTTRYTTNLNNQSAGLPKLPIQYTDYAIWQRNYLQGKHLETQLDYWKQQLSNLPTVLEIPTDHPRPAIQTYHGSHETFDLDEEITRELVQFCQQEGVTLYMLLLAIYQVLLYRYSGQEDIAVGTAIANRNSSEIENLIGFFVNTLVIRTDLSAEPTFRELVKRVREVCLVAYSHQDLPFEMLVEVLHPERNLSHSPLFQVAFDMQTPPSTQPTLPGLELQPVIVDSGMTPYDLLLSVSHIDHHLIGSLQYSSDLFNSGTIQRFLVHYKELIVSAMKSPAQPISHLSMLTAEERQQILVEWNNTAHPYPDHHCIQQLFEKQAGDHPEDTALVYNDLSMSYQELNCQANYLANHLLEIGMIPETVVGICIERSFDMIIGILGVLKAGGTYLPLDPFYPPGRLTYMLEDSRAPILLTHSSLVDSFPSSTSVQKICLDENHPLGLDKNPIGRVGPDQLAYLIYTSGSTGKPKGAMLRHRGLCNLVDVQKRTFEIERESRILQFSSFSFDASVWEIFMALANGATLILAPYEILSSGPDLVDLLRKQRITHITLSPSVLSILPPTDLPDLKVLISAGESCSSDLVNRWGYGQKFFNAYGPTETTVCAAMALCSPEDKLPPSIGQPISNTHLYVMDQHQEILPAGIPGELVIGGVCVGRGYLNRPEITAEKFIANQYTNGTPDLLYRTGDQVRYRKDGNLEFLGRIDHQVKIRGFRIELGEIENALLDQTGIKQAVAVVREDRPGDKRLAAYLVSEEPDQPPTGSLLREALKSRLPDYMIPSWFIFMDAIPLNPNGKVDRKRLPAPQEDLISVDHGARTLPQTPTEVRLAEICQSVLGVGQVYMEDNFFELGGHSLLATQLISRLRNTFQVDLPLRVLFEHPTLKELMNYLDEHPSEQMDNLDTIEKTLQQVSELSMEDLEAMVTSLDQEESEETS